jgi:cobalt-zinc-cadmium efflux system protein
MLDSILTLGIAAYVLIMSVSMLRRAARILMEGTPPDLDLDAVTASMKAIESVEDVHHLHAWELDEHHRALEAHVVVALACSHEAIDRVRLQLRELLAHDFEIGHATLEFEWSTTACEHEFGSHTCNQSPDENPGA